MSLLKKTVLLSAAFGVAATMALSDGNTPTEIERGIKARQAQMTLYSFNIGILGAMAKGDVEYNAEDAGLAASNLAALSAVWMPGAWLPGRRHRRPAQTVAGHGGCWRQRSGIGRSGTGDDAGCGYRSGRAAQWYWRGRKILRRVSRIVSRQTITPVLGPMADAKADSLDYLGGGCRVVPVLGADPA